jgi:hypothetical protein
MIVKPLVSLPLNRYGKVASALTTKKLLKSRSRFFVQIKAQGRRRALAL